MNDVSGEGRVIPPEAVISPERRDASRRSSVCFALRALASSEISTRGRERVGRGRVGGRVGLGHAVG